MNRAGASLTPAIPGTLPCPAFLSSTSRPPFLFLIVGIGMGLQMSISGIHNVTGAHAHANLLGWVTMALFGGFYALNPAKAQSRARARAIRRLHGRRGDHGPGLYLMLAGNQAFEPLVAAGSMIAFLGVILFAVLVFAPDRQQSARTSAPRSR